jgi:hypothetical protein
MDAEQNELATLIFRLRRGITWKPSAAARHLLKRKLRGHLPTDATLADYEAVISQVLEAADSSIYVYYRDESTYLSMASWLDGRLWLVIVSFEGIIETAFVVENPESYLERAAFQFIGKMSEVVR